MAFLERMFEDVHARFDEMIERRYPSKTSESAALLGEIGAAARAENRSAAVQLDGIGRLFGYRLSRCIETEEWAIDTMEAVAAEVAWQRKLDPWRGLIRVTRARF